MFEDISLISYPNQNVGLHTDPFSSLIRLLKLDVSNRMHGRLPEVPEIGRGATRPINLFDNLLLFRSESVVVLTIPLLHLAVHLQFLLIVLHPLEEEAATHRKRVLENLQNDLGMSFVQCQTHGFVSFPRGIHAGVCKEDVNNVRIPLLGCRIQSVERSALFGLINELHRVDALATENVANDVRMASVDGPVERGVVDRDVRK